MHSLGIPYTHTHYTLPYKTCFFLHSGYCLKLAHITPALTRFFTANLRRQFANDRCNSSSFPFLSFPFISFLVVTNFFCFAFKTFLVLRNFGRPSRNLASVGSNFATILSCFSETRYQSNQRNISGY